MFVTHCQTILNHDADDVADSYLLNIFPIVNGIEIEMQLTVFSK